MPVFLSAKTPSIGRALHGRALKLGLVNNMPDAALSRTERQFIDIVDAATPDLAVNVAFFAVPEIARGEIGCGHLARQGYRSTRTLPSAGLDALIVTGTEPKQPNLRNEPFWPALASLFDWIERDGPSVAFSCLGAHAAVLHYDGIERRRLSEKRCGLFEHAVVGDHSLVKNLPPSVQVAHSRWNQVSRADLETKDYTVLTEAPDAGVDLFIKQTRNLMLFFQGHPEYDSGTLFREYRRDAQRFIAGERDVYPQLPKNYFDAQETHLLNGFQHRAVAARNAALAEEFPLEHPASNDNVSPMAGVFRAWLNGIAAAKGVSSVPETRRVAGIR